MLRDDPPRLWGGAAYTGPNSGKTAAAITVRPIDDAIPEPDETVILTLSPDANYIIRFAQHRHRYDSQQRVAPG